ncbi:TRAM domain-containing protein [Candidatus Marsarchaeota archaeon]|nr:TRAM domain-containing protein [Candidatus Marsarchaeota archaeon]
MSVGDVIEGGTYEMKVNARSYRGEGIGKIDDLVVFVKNAKTRIGKVYKIKITKLHRTFADAELLDGSAYLIGNGSLITA